MYIPIMGIPTGGTDPTLGIGIDLIMVGTLTGMIPIGIHRFMGTDMGMPVSMEVLAFIVLTMVPIGITARIGMVITEIVIITMAIMEVEILPITLEGEGRHQIILQIGPPHCTTGLRLLTIELLP